MFKKRTNPYYKNFLEAADSIRLPEDDRDIIYTEPDAHPFFLYPTGIILGLKSGISHGTLTSRVKTFIHFYKEGADPESNEIQIHPYPVSSPFEKDIEDINHIDGRIWFSNKVIAFWESSEELNRYPIDYVFELVKLRGYNPKDFQYHPAELDRSMSQPINGKRYDAVYSYEEFLNKIGKPQQVDKDALNAKLAAHLMDGNYKKKVLGAKPKINTKPFANYYTKNESVIVESPDTFDDGDIIHTWKGEDTITFIGDKRGNLILGRRISHNIMQQVLYAHYVWDFNAVITPENERKMEEMSILKSKTKQLKIISKREDLDEFIDGVAADLSVTPDKYVRKISAFPKYSVGRIFVEGGAASFWNKFEQLNSDQKYAIIGLLVRAGVDPEFAEYEVNPQSHDSMGTILTYDEFLQNTTSTETDDRDTEKIETLHTLPPEKKGYIMKTKGIKPKLPSPLYWKQLLHSESFQDIYDQKTPQTLKYYAFDWDDNLLHMPTKITLQLSNSKLFEIGTEDYAKYKNHLKEGTSFLYEGNSILATTIPSSYERFRVSHDKQFLEEVKVATPGPAWVEFVKAVNNGRIFSIVTARGHHPETLKEAVKYLITESVNGLDYYTCLDNLKLMHEFSHSDSNYSDDELFERYLSKLCKYYPVTYNNESAVSNIEGAKASAIEEFCQHVNECFNNMNSEFRSRVSNNFIIGFSDDDHTNTSHIAEQFDSALVEVTLTKKHYR
jgi:hypothetical protein